MQVEIIMPKMGESITEGTILRWMKNEGEKIQKDEILLEISTDKVDSEIPSPVSGVLIKKIANEQDTVPVGTVIAYIETDNSNAIEFKTSDLQQVAPTSTIFTTRNEIIAPAKKVKAMRTNRFNSPLVKRIIQEEKLSADELNLIVGSGFNGRVTKKDILRFLEYRKNLSIKQDSKKYNFIQADIDELKKKYPEPDYQVVRMNNIQRVMAEHMLRSVRTTPHVTIVDEVDLTEIMNYRFRILEVFEKQQGFKLTVTPFFAYTAIKALKEYPILNSAVEDDAIIYKKLINLGIAVASPTGLIVPVIRNAEAKSFNDLANAINDVSVRAKSKKLTLNEISDGTFSITNYGVFGNVIGTPIINQPQVGILGIGAIKKRPVVVNDAIEIRSMVYLTLSFDHRIVDGETGGKFLTRVKWYLENFDFKEIS